MDEEDIPQIFFNVSSTRPGWLAGWPRLQSLAWAAEPGMGCPLVLCAACQPILPCRPCVLPPAVHQDKHGGGCAAQHHGGHRG